MRLSITILLTILFTTLNAQEESDKNFTAFEVTCDGDETTYQEQVEALLLDVPDWVFDVGEEIPIKLVPKVEVEVRISAAYSIAVPGIAYERVAAIEAYRQNFNALNAIFGVPPVTVQQFIQALNFKKTFTSIMPVGELVLHLTEGVVGPVPVYVKGAVLTSPYDKKKFRYEAGIGVDPFFPVGDRGLIEVKFGIVYIVDQGWSKAIIIEAIQPGATPELQQEFRDNLAIYFAPDDPVGEPNTIALDFGGSYRYLFNNNVSVMIEAGWKHDMKDPLKRPGGGRNSSGQIRLTFSIKF